jgi:purine-binding chemotaxis protein CheW
MQNTKLAIFKLGDEVYGMDILEVGTIEKHIPINRVTNSPHNMLGVMRLREKIIPVYSLRRKFGMEEKKYDANTRYIVTTSNGIPVAFEVDDMEQIIPLEPEQMLDLPLLVKTQDTSFMKYVCKVDDRLALVLDHNQLLEEDDQKTMRAILKSIQ